MLRNLKLMDSSKNKALKVKYSPKKEFKKPINSKETCSKKRSKFVAISITFLSIVALLTLIFSTFLIWFNIMAHKNLNKANLFLKPCSSAKIQNVKNLALIVQNKNNLAETILIAELHENHKKAFLYSLDISGLVEKASNSSETLNLKFKGNEQNLIAAINQKFSLQISDYIAISFKGVLKFLSSFNDFEVSISEIEKNLINLMLAKTKILNKKANLIQTSGKIKLTGPQLLCYSRIPNSGSLKQTNHQQTAINLILLKLSKLNSIELLKIFKTIFPNITTSLTLPEILKIVSEYH